MSSLIFVQLLLLGLKVISTTTDTWRHCTDLLPLDLLSFVLERDPSKLVPGVHMKQAGGVRGVHFSSPHTSMSFPSSQLLVNCDLFPKEFSIVVTLKVTHAASTRNEYIFSLMDPKTVEKTTMENDKGEEQDGQEKMKMEEKQGKNNEDRGRIVLGLRFSKKHLHFLFKVHGGVVEHWVFRGTQLADNHWHTLVLTVGSRVRLTVDCNSPVEIVPSTPFPSDINIQGSRFHIGSRGRWKGLFSGLLRQLVLVPGLDATRQICPSSDPQLAALSVPPLLLDLPVMGREGDNSLTSYEMEEPVSVGLEHVCSELQKGQLWFNPLKKGLYLCDGAAWITVLEDHKRLDYVLEHQILTTSSETHDVEIFQVPGMGLMAAMAHRSKAFGSAVYLWTQSGFKVYQNITTHEALVWRHFNMGKKVYLVVSNSGGGPQSQYNNESEMDVSVIYKWSKKRKKFVRFQTLQTHCARDWEAFNINQQSYLAVANHRQGNNNHTIDSVIYKWNRSTKSFEVHQRLLTSGAYDWEFFSVGPYHFLVVANAFDGVTTSVDSVIYIWVKGNFQVFQTIKTFCATDWEMFQIGNRVFLVVANGHRLHGNGPSRYAINSTIYELDMNEQLFVRFQDIVTYSAVDWEFFTLGEEHFLVVANSFNGESYSLNSILYREETEFIYLNSRGMFGNLFEEDEEEGFSSTSSKGRVSKAGDEPPPARGRTNLCGIKNQGGTCYLNSLLQTLLFTPEFREELFSLGPGELGSLEDKETPGAKVRVIPLELQRLFARLLLVDQQSATTADLTDSFGWNSSEGTNQHDVQELNRILFSALEHSLVGTTGSTFIHRLYHGTIVNSIVCKECGNVSQRQEDFLDLTVCVCGVSSLEEALWNMFVEEELFEGNNLYRCAQCDRLVTAAKSAKLKKLPPFMTMSLLRFSFDFAKCERYKETGRYSFPRTINLRPFCEQTDGDDSDYSYDLFSVIIHKGGCYGGHYHVYIRDIDQLGQWEPPEEDCKPKTQRKVKEEAKEVCEPKLQEDDPLSVLTAIIAQEPSKSVLIDQLGQKLMDKIGSSWSKKFRKHYGPIGKFLQSHSDVFMLVSGGTRVALKANLPSPVTEPPDPAEQTTNSDPSTSSDPGAAEQPQKPNQKPELEPEQGSHWFDLNDSAVTSIRESDIEKQFQGKESAYMLFYRKTQLHRPSDALNNPQYKVPSHLIQMAQEENIKLQQMREKFEATNNTVELHLHLAPSYRLENGALQPADKGHVSTTLSFDRRKTVGDLRLAIYQMQELWEGDMALTVAKSFPAGLHLYNTLTDDSVSLYSAGIYTNCDLFVWNGREVCGATVLTGAEWEPVLLTVVRPFLGEDMEQEVRDAMECEESRGGYENGGLGLKKEERGFAGRKEKRTGAGEGGGASGWRVFPPDDMQRTLKELSLKDGDALLVLEPQSFDSSVFTLNGDVVTVTTPSDCRWLQVDFRPHVGQGSGGEDEKEEERRKIKVPATGNMLLCEVKQRALEELQLHEPGAQFCLRQVDCTGKLLPPVCEELSVRDAGVRLMTTLTLCPGTAPKASQCLKAMLDAVGLDGSCWHLRWLDWCEEVGEPLMDEDACLSELKISSGDTLVVTEGQLPPKGFLKLSIWLDPKNMEKNFNHPQNGHAEEVETDTHPPPLVLTLPALQSMCIPTTAFMRVWQIEGHRLTRILRGQQLTLRKLKLSSGTDLCVQQLLKEEDLGPKEVLLNVKMGVPGERCYYPPEELVWDASRDSSPRSLRTCLAAHYGLSPDSLLLAKHQPDKHTWEEISNWSQQVSKKKKKKRTESLLGAPFHLKDGDTIGIKNLLIDNNRHFITEQDEKGQQKLREHAEQNRKGGEPAGSGEAGPQKKAGQTKSRKPEVALSISVGEFR
ncbi:hypothetical protein INR49_019817 [Caranx melampygus]|nr:hypothetical protein INR49_019817 [Caranx melampygus]